MPVSSHRLGRHSTASDASLRASRINSGALHASDLRSLAPKRVCLSVRSIKRGWFYSLGIAIMALGHLLGATIFIEGTTSRRASRPNALSASSVTVLWRATGYENFIRIYGTSVLTGLAFGILFAMNPVRLVFDGLFGGSGLLVSMNPVRRPHRHTEVILSYRDCLSPA